MRPRKIVFLIGACCVLWGGTAGAADVDPIDAALDRCLKASGGETTVGMVDCTETAIKAWDARLNQVYRKTMTSLDPKSQELLRASQRKWVAFREAERASLGGPWRDDAGTLAQVTTANAVLSAIKERVEELAVYPGN